MSTKRKELPRIGITIGDFNGIGPEVTLKALKDSRILELCTPLVYASPKIINTYKNLLHLDKVKHHILKSKDLDAINNKVVNIVNCLDDQFEITPGEATEIAGKSALTLLDEALDDLQSGYINALVTAPLNKSLIKTDPEFTGHTEYITAKFEAEESMMFLVSEKLKMGLATNHLPIKEVADALKTDTILKKLKIMNQSLMEDFGLNAPRIAVFGLNPHAGDNGLLGREELEIIKPAIQKAQEKGILVFGPFPADGFMGSGSYKNFDGILAMYHDQGLVAFKSLTFSGGVNHTAGLPIVRTSPDHGTAYDIAGKGEANAGSMREAIFTAIDIFRNRQDYAEYHADPLKKSKKAKA